MLLRLLSVAALASALTVEPVEEKPVKLKMIEGFSFADPPQDCHYADPWKQACKSDELAAEIPAQPQSLKICVSKCSADSDCPTDVCPGTTSTPRCFLQDATGQKYCGLPCHVKTSQKCSSDEHMVCQTEGAGGICGYAS